MFTPQRRQEVERAIVRATIEEAEKQGWTLYRVSNGEEIVRTDSHEAALEAAFACDEAHLHFGTSDGQEAWVFIVLGNDGWDVICDYTLSFNAVIDATDRLVEKFERESQEQPLGGSRCPDCGQPGERKGHQTCQYPS
jgi:hypothetical protein